MKALAAAGVLALLAAPAAQAACQARLGQADAALALSADGGTLAAQAIAPRWTLPPGRQIAALLSFDDRAPVAAAAWVAGPGIVRLELAAPAAFVDALRRARRLAIQAGGARVAVALDGAPAALDRLAACGDGAWRAPVAGGNPFLGGAPAAAADPPPLPAAAAARPATAAAGAPDWPALQRRMAPMPHAATDGSPYAAPELRRRIDDSVYVVWIDRGIDDRWTNQGSAVAISTDTLLTNCHVVDDSRRMALRQAGRSARPSLLTGDSPTDRCFIRVEGLALVPVAGVRRIDSLAVGEAVYSLGNPEGHERVFGSGTILGVERRRDGLTVVRTSAPMTHGSSGGGLFDGYGNLVGITSYGLVGTDGRVAARYAIAAEEFWR